MNKKNLSLILLIFLYVGAGKSQPRVIDQVIAVVGDKRILYSDVESQYYQIIAQGEKPTSETRCQIFEQLLIQKLLLNQAEVDSIEILETQVDAALDERMRYFVNMIGSEQKLEDYFKKTTLESRKISGMPSANRC
jgi:peptidyl-prolyl cis-trans isomerase SurA